MEVSISREEKRTRWGNRTLYYYDPNTPFMFIPIASLIIQSTYSSRYVLPGNPSVSYLTLPPSPSHPHQQPGAVVK